MSALNPPTLYFLATFELPREASRHPPLSGFEWKLLLGDDPDAVVASLKSRGLLEIVPVAPQLHIRFTAQILAGWCRERGLATSGAKQDLVLRLVTADRVGMTERVSDQAWLHCSSEGRRLLEDQKREGSVVRRYRPSPELIAVLKKLGEWTVAGVVGNKATELLNELLAGHGTVQTAKASTGIKTQINPKDGLEYVWIPPGRFRMGASPDDNEAFEDEKPAHEVTISKGFWMGKTPVTQAAWERVMRTTPSKFKGDRLPVESVSWDDANLFARKVGLRLPTEAEWEYAARAGTTGSRYGELDEIAWYSDNSDSRTHPVAMKRPNDFGLHDMLGNVWEWVSDFYGTYGAGPVDSPQGPLTGTFRVLRGGSWSYVASNARASWRDWYAPSIRNLSLGFRCAGE